VTSSRELHLATADRPKNEQGLSIPIISKTIVSDNSDTKYTGFYFRDNGQLQVVFTYLDSFQRRGVGEVQDTLNSFTKLLSVAGSQGDPSKDAKKGTFQINLPEKRSKDYKSGSIAFSVNITADGVDKIFHASADEIQKSALRFFPANKVLASEITAVLTQDRDASPAKRNDALRDLIAKSGNSNIVADSVRTALSFIPVARAQELLTSSTNPDVSYLKMMEVLASLAGPTESKGGPTDISANLALTIDKGIKHSTNAKANISVNEDQGNTDLLMAGLANRERTIQPQFMDINH
jgi:hypothetical protein